MPKMPIEFLIKMLPIIYKKNKQAKIKNVSNITGLRDIAPPPFSFAANTIFKTGLISFTATMITHPVKIVSYHLLENATLTLSTFVRSYRGSIGTSIIAGQQRGASSGVAKHVSKTSGESEEVDVVTTEEYKLKSSNSNINKDYILYHFCKNPWLQAGAFSQLDLVSSSYLCNKGTIISLGNKIPTISAIGLTAYIKNAWTIFRTGYSFRTLGGFVSFGSLIKGTEIANSAVPDNYKRTQIGTYMSGAITGAFNAVITYPINVSAEMMMLNVKVIEDKVTSPSTMGFFKQRVNHLKNKGFLEVSIEFMMQAKTQLPMRITTSILLFSVINGMQDSLGHTPLDDLAKSAFSK